MEKWVWTLLVFHNNPLMHSLLITMEKILPNFFNKKIIISWSLTEKKNNTLKCLPTNQNKACIPFFLITLLFRICEALPVRGVPLKKTEQIISNHTVVQQLTRIRQFDWMSWTISFMFRLQHSQKKRYKSRHWGCTFSKGTLLYPKLHITTLVVLYILAPKIYILAPKMDILAPEMYTWTLKM